MRRGALPRYSSSWHSRRSRSRGARELSKSFHTTPSDEKPPLVAPEEKPPVVAPEEKPPVVAPEEKPPVVAPDTKPPSAPPAAKPPAIPAADKLFAEGMTALQEGGHERALELFSAAWQEKPGHPGVAREFDRALLALKKNGDAAYALGKWEDAGKRWMGTLRFITHPAANPGAYPFTRSEVQTKVDRLTACVDGEGADGVPPGGDSVGDRRLEDDPFLRPQARGGDPLDRVPPCSSSRR